MQILNHQSLTVDPQAYWVKFWSGRKYQWKVCLAWMWVERQNRMPHFKTVDMAHSLPLPADFDLVGPIANPDQYRNDQEEHHIMDIEVINPPALDYESEFPALNIPYPYD